jgi:hypothetical protein
VEIFQGAHQSAIYTIFNLPYEYNFITNCAGNNQKLYKIIRMNMFAAQYKVKPETENLRGLNLVAVMLMTVQTTKLLLLL